ncbi:MAG: radical SAM protein [Blastochloris sp.]|nr:radical SAM protein [Blastochloris sp.]
MRLLIIHPCVGRRVGQRDYIRTWKMQPLPPALMAALAKATLGTRVEILFLDDRMDLIDENLNVDLVCLSVETYTARRAYQIAGIFRRRKIPVVMGGFHPTLCPDEVMRFAESIVVGEAEESFPRLLLDFVAGRMDRIYRVEKRPSTRVRPDRSIFQGKRYLPIGLVEYSRGCRFSCDFCAITAAFKASHTHADLGQVLEEIEEVRRPGQLIFFIDDNFASDPESARVLCQVLKGKGVRWVSQASSTATWDPELLNVMRESGCQGVLVGLESLNETALKTMRKSFNLKNGGHVETLARLSQAGLRVYGTFIFGYDTDTPEVFETTVEFAIRHGLFIAAFNHITPFPGTPLYRRLEEEQRLVYDAWWMDSRYRYNEIPFTPRGMSREELERGCLDARRRFYSWSGITRRFGSHALLRQGARMSFNYWIINAMHQRDVMGRSGMPLGDANDTRPLVECAL